MGARCSDVYAPRWAVDVNPLIGRTCWVWIAETTRWGMRWGVDQSPPITTPAHKEQAIIMEVHPVYIAEPTGNVVHGWNLLLLLEGGTLVSAPHHEVKVE